ncbi:hypothetical protein P0D69_06830 [Paraburkholderia sediminicola]|uniref:hypothetical protein n=1 Tax=Paraburkholderia sediminicola TaxID=458836 RepID=UPI0038BC1AB5
MTIGTQVVAGHWRVEVVTRGHGEHRLLGRFCLSSDADTGSSRLFHGAAGQHLFHAIDGTTVHESDVILVGASRESEFLAQNVGADAKMISSPK